MCNIERDLLTCNGIKTVVCFFFNYEKNCIYFLKKRSEFTGKKVAVLLHYISAVATNA